MKKDDKLPKEIREEKVFWNVLRIVYRLLASDEAQLIMRQLLREDNIRTSVLLDKTGLKEFQFHPVMKQLAKYGIVEKKVWQDRSVRYSISPFGKYVLKLTEPLLAKIKESVKDELIATV